MLSQDNSDPFTKFVNTDPRMKASMYWLEDVEPVENGSEYGNWDWFDNYFAGQNLKTLNKFHILSASKVYIIDVLKQEHNLELFMYVISRLTLLIEVGYLSRSSGLFDNEIKAIYDEYRIVLGPGDFDQQVLYESETYRLIAPNISNLLSNNKYKIIKFSVMISFVWLWCVENSSYNDDEDDFDDEDGGLVIAD